MAARKREKYQLLQSIQGRLQNVFYIYSRSSQITTEGLICSPIFSFTVYSFAFQLFIGAQLSGWSE